MSACASRPPMNAAALSPCPNWATIASRWARGESVSLYIPGDTTAHQQEYSVTVDSLLPDRGCFADSLAGALGARVGWVYQSFPAFTLSHLSDSGLAQARRMPHVVQVTPTVRFRITDTIRVEPRAPRATSPVR
jgi:hypothetical protein